MGRPVTSQFVYAIVGCDAVKIGHAVAPEFRLKLFQAGSPIKLDLVGYVEGGQAHERELHARFSEYRLHGEWFQLCGEVADWVETVRGKGKAA